MTRTAAYPLTECPPLPQEAYLPESLSEGACPWLDEYVNFSRFWSPRSYEGYHVGCGLFVLSTISARRVMVHLGKPRFPNLFIALVGRTSTNAKSSAAGIATAIISELGMDYFLLPDTCTPQSMIEVMASIPDNFNNLPGPQQAEWQAKIAFLGQKGWFHEEFGGLLTAMMKKDGVMAEFKSILRRFDDNEEKIDYSTIVRGYRKIVKPFLSFLGLLTPAELQPYARRGASLWHDGFLARIMFIVAPSDYMRDGRFPPGERKIPDSLLTPLREWNNRLGTPIWKVSGRDVCYEPFQPQTIMMGEEVSDAYYNYDKAIRDLVFQASCHDLDGNYTRLPEKALRIAMLFASLDNVLEIQMKHWARAQQIAEDLRRDIHTLYSQVQEINSSEGSRTKIKTVEEKVMGVIDRDEAPRKREIEQATGLSSADVTAALNVLIKNGIVEEQPDGKTSRFVRISSTALSAPDGLI